MLDGGVKAAPGSGLGLTGPLLADRTKTLYASYVLDDKEQSRGG